MTMAAQKFELAVLPGAPRQASRGSQGSEVLTGCVPFGLRFRPPCTEDSGEARTAVYALTMAPAVRVE